MTPAMPGEQETGGAVRILQCFLGKGGLELTVTKKDLADALWAEGHARLGNVLTRDACEAIRGRYDAEGLFRSRIDMARHRFGRGEYRYFSYPLPQPVERLRRHFYRLLAPIAAEWMTALDLPGDFPDTLEAFLGRCHAKGQKRPTPLLLRYRAGDYNCLHQDLYGPIVFPFQVIVGLSAPGTEFAGGELLLVEQRPRAQSVGRVLPLAQGEGVVITTRYRPVRGTKGLYRGNVRHGVSVLSAGERFALGLIFHDAE